MTASCFAHPALFDLSAIAAEGDPDLRPGVHVRVITAPEVGLPLAPFVLFPLHVTSWEPKLVWMRPDGTPASPVDPVHIGCAAAPTPYGLLPVAWEVERRSGIAEVQTLHRDENRVLARCVRAPYLLPTCWPSRLAVRGRSGQPAVRGWAVNVSSPSVLSRALEGQLAEDRILSLPVDGDRAWYAGGRGRKAGARRVEIGAPLRLGPPDAVQAPFAPLPPASEIARLARISPGADHLLQLALDDPDVLPGEAQFEHFATEDITTKTPAQWSGMAATQAVVAQSLDPTLGRYLGYLARLQTQPTSILGAVLKGVGLARTARVGGAPTVWGVAGVFAVDRSQLEPVGAFPLLGPPDAEEAQLLARLGALFPALRHVVGRASERGLEVRALVAVAAAVPAWAPPAAPQLALGDGTWSRSGAGEAFRRLIQVVDPPAAPLTAVARKPAGGSAFTPAHDVVVPSPPARVASRLIGESAPSGPPYVEPAAWIAEDGLTAADAPWRYRIRLGDLFGRYGDPAEIDAPPPPRPLPPRPEAGLSPLAAPRAADTAPAPWGALDVRVPTPAPADLAAGALPITALEWTSDGGKSWSSEAVAGPTVWTRTLTLPSLEPKGAATYSIAFHFKDSDGQISAPFEQSFVLHDPRQPPPVKTGTGIIWTSRPGPAEEVELELMWQAKEGDRFRAYMCDAALIDVQTVDADGRPTPRARIASLGTAPGAIRPGKRPFFQLLTDPAVVALPDGKARLRTRLPRRLTDVRFVTIVELSPEGVEGEFGAGGLTAVAVPSDVAPPPPRLLVSAVDSQAGAAVLRIEAEGLDLALFRETEPGLFGNPGPGVAPRYRLRRTGGRQGDPLYAEIVHEGELKLEQAGAAGQRFVADVADGQDAPLQPFVEYAYWAEVQMPPERRLPPDALPIVGQVTGVTDAQSADQPGLWSPPSVCAVAIAAPEAPELADGHLTVTLVARSVDRSTVKLALAAPPLAHPRAVASYSLRVWPPQGLADLGSSGPVDVPITSAGLSAPTPDLVLAGAPTMLKAAIVDPLGRCGPVRDVPVTGA